HRVDALPGAPRDRPAGDHGRHARDLHGRRTREPGRGPRLLLGRPTRTPELGARRRGQRGGTRPAPARPAAASARIGYVSQAAQASTTTGRPAWRTSCSNVSSPTSSTPATL